jgi:hypothetical protein
MKIIGYSERGVLNAILFEIGFSLNSSELVSRLLNRASFPFCTLPSVPINHVTTLVEQSFSDFGDADAVLLVDAGETKFAVFAEAKVKSSQTARWKIQEAFGKFRNGLEAKLGSSNIFTQLYHKVCLTKGMMCPDTDALHVGLKFPGCSTKPTRRIGSNCVVLRAVELVRPYARDAYYLAIVPDTPANVDNFFRDELRPLVVSELEEWDVTRWGFLCWSDIYEFCKAEELHRSLEVLDFNRGQIW